jgi:acetyl-CoA carboxylase biotin carboxyl carrier protein
MALTDDDVREILRIIDASDVSELRIETNGFSLYVRRGPAEGADALSAAAPTGTDSLPSPATTPAPAPTRAPTPPAVTGAEPPPPPSAEGAASDDGLAAVPSPMLGTFYRAESPGAAPFVEVGSPVTPETTVCIIEVMKMMNSVPAGVAGTIAEICAQNAQLVEYGQPLFRVRVDGD